MVRKIQGAYYSSPSYRSSSSSTGGEGEGSVADAIGPDGSVDSLPLWRVGWTELPGRSNVLTVHDGRYTHMFESVLRGGGGGGEGGERLFGHLRLPGGSASLSGGGDGGGPLDLRGWEDEGPYRERVLYDTDDGDDNGAGGGVEGGGEGPKSAVIGTLMRIVDHRRMSDGKMLLLVQALERFVVVRPVRELPYSVADVMLFPDEEEVRYRLNVDDAGEGEGEGGPTRLTEVTAAPARYRALASSRRWQEYEFEAMARLPVRDDKRDDLTVSDIVGTALRDVMPFLPYSVLADPLLIAEADGRRVDPSELDPPPDDVATLEDEEGSIEERLVDYNIMRSRLRLKRLRVSDMDQRVPTNNTEERLWILIDDFVRIRRLQSVPAKLLSLLPRNKEWPADFVLKGWAEKSAKENPKFASQIQNYPSLRRQRSLSYAAVVLLEKMPMAKVDSRQRLLEYWSTKDRLL